MNQTTAIVLLVITGELVLAVLGIGCWVLGARHGRAQAVRTIGDTVTTTLGGEGTLGELRLVPDAEPIVGVPDRPIAAAPQQPVPAPVPDAVLAAPKPSWLAALMASEVIVHKTDGISIEGLLVLETERGIVLRQAKVLDDGGRSPTALMGDQWIAQERIGHVQTKDNLASTLHPVLASASA